MLVKQKKTLLKSILRDDKWFCLDRGVSEMWKVAGIKNQTKHLNTCCLHSRFQYHYSRFQYCNSRFQYPVPQHAGVYLHAHKHSLSSTQKHHNYKNKNAFRPFPMHPIQLCYIQWKSTIELLKARPPKIN